MDRNTVSAASRSARVLLALTATALLASVHANDWEFSADLFSGLTFTDNVTLAPNGLKQDEVIWEISPTVIATRDGKRFDVQLEYRLQGLLYADEDGRNEAYNYLQTQAQTVVVPDLLYFDADASISQTVIDPLISNGNSSISTNGNIAETTTINVSPYIFRQLGPATTFRAGALAGLVEYDDDLLIDNTQQDLFATLANSGGGGLLNWSFGYNETIVDYDGGANGFDQEIELARLTGEIGFRLGPRTEFVVSGGEDINDFGDLTGSRIAEGTFWNAGFRGEIGTTITFDIRAGEQFFGDSYGIEFSRTSRSLETSMSYSEEATTVGAQQLDFSNALSLLGLAGNLNNQFDVNGFELPQRDPELYIRRRGDFNNTFSTAKSTVRLGVYYEDREFIRSQFAGAREQVQGARLEWLWNYDSATSVSTSALYQRLTSRDNVSEPKDLRVSVQVRREIFNNSYIDAIVWRNGRSAPRASTEFEEHALRVGFGRRF